jgi:hypothetical protein
MHGYSEHDLFRVARFVLASHTTLTQPPSVDTVDAAARILLAYDRRLAKRRSLLARLSRRIRVWRTGSDARRMPNTPKEKRPITKKGIARVPGF